MDTLHPQSDLTRWMASLYWEVIAWDTLILTLVVTLIVLIIGKFSSRGDAQRTQLVPAQEHIALEMLWTAGPAFVLFVILVPAVVLNFRTQPRQPPANALQIQVIAHQWWWEFRYLNAAVKPVVCANEAHIPVGQPVRLWLESADVIHSFFVPQLAAKRDMIPGHVNQLTFVPDRIGEYYGQCAEFCGLSHANMRMRIFVDSPTRFAAWMANQSLPAQALIARTSTARSLVSGARVYEESPCTACHTIKGVSKGTLAPDLTHFGSRTTLAGGTYNNNPATLTAWIQHPDRLKPGAEMPGLELQGQELAALVTYLEHLK